MATNNSSDAEKHSNATMKILATYIGLMALCFIVMQVSDFFAPPSATNGATPFVTWSWGWAFIWVLFFHLLLSIRKVEADEIGALLLFGRPLWQVSSGPVIAPLGIFTLKKETASTIQLELPGEPEEVQKYDEDNIRPGKKAPIRIVQSPAESAVFYSEDGTTKRTWVELSDAEKAAVASDPLSRRLTTEVSIIVRWRIVNYILFLKNIKKVDNANRQIEDTVVAATQDMLGVVTAGHTLQRKEFFSNRIHDAVEKLIGDNNSARAGGLDSKSWGMEAINTQIKLSDPGQTVNLASANAAAAVSKAEEQVRLATSQKKATELGGDAKAYTTRVEGEATAGAIKAKLLAEAEGLAKKAEVAETPGGALVSRLDAAERAMENSQYTIVPGGDLLNPLLSAFASAQETLKRTTDASTKKASTEPAKPAGPPIEVDSNERLRKAAEARKKAPESGIITL